MDNSPFTTRPELAGTFGMVASTHWLATAAAMAVLEEGGNAFDAAVAAGFTLQVVEPHLNGPGGEVPVVFARGDARDGGPAPVVLCGQGVAPAGATIDAFRDLGLELVPGPACLPRRCPAPWAPGWRCCATTARCRWRPFSASRSTTPRPVTPSCHG